jgi:hypothetical protein
MIRGRRVVAQQGEGAMSYFAKVGRAGPIGYHQVPGSIDVFGAVDDSEPIGIAHCINWGGHGAAQWELTVHGSRLPGQYIVIDREFIPVAQQSGQAPRAG